MSDANFKALYHLNALTSNDNVIMGNFLFQTKSRTNKMRLKKLEKFFCEYYGNSQKLADMLVDEKVQRFFNDSIDEILSCEVKLQVKNICAQCLMPMIGDVDLGRGMRYYLEHADEIRQLYAGSPTDFGFPLIILNTNYIVDGHSRWFSQMAFNPEGEMLCCDIKTGVSPLVMNRIINPNLSDNSSRNFYKMSAKEITDFVNKEIDSLTSTNNLLEVMAELNPKIKNINDVVEYISENLCSTMANNYPIFNRKY